MSSLFHLNSKNDKEFLIAVKTEYKLLEKKYLKAQDKLKKWETRINIAGQAGKVNLKIEAEEQAEIIRNNIKYLTEQLSGLKQEVEKAVNEIKIQPRKLSIDPNKLFADIKNLIGNSSTLILEKQINEIKVDNELKRLKNSL